MGIYYASRCSLTSSDSVYMEFPLYRSKDLPNIPFSKEEVMFLFENASRNVSSGKFLEAIELFKSCLQKCIFLCSLLSDSSDLKEIINSSREYVVALQMELYRKELPADKQKRSLELSAYFTHFNMDGKHLALALRAAMISAFKLKCLHSSLGFARRLLELGPQPEIAQQARKIISLAEKSPQDEVLLEYNPLNPFVVCASTYEPLYKGGKPSVHCPYCGASYIEKQKGGLCVCCDVSKIGLQVSGFQ
jgi:coatomer protein complex subunit alpha (xenin)